MRHKNALTFATILLFAYAGARVEAQVDLGLNEARGLAMSGRSLSKQDVDSLEEQVAKTPDDVGSRMKLLVAGGAPRTPFLRFLRTSSLSTL